MTNTIKPFTVEQLIEKLKNCNTNAVVNIPAICSSGYETSVTWGEVFDHDVEEIRIGPEKIPVVFIGSL